MFQKDQTGKGKISCGWCFGQQTNGTDTYNLFGCGSEDHLIEKCQNPPKDSQKRRKQVHFNEKGNRACDNGKNKSDQKIYASMAHMSGNDEYPSGSFGDRSQWINWNLDSGSMCHMTPEVSDFILGSLEDTDKHTKVADRHPVTEKKCQVRIKMCDNNGDTFIATLHNVLLVPYLCDRLFSIITLMNLGHTCLFQKWFCTVYFRAKQKNSVTLPHSAQRKHAFWGEIKEMPKTKKLPARKKINLEVLHKRLGHRSPRYC